MLGSDREFTIRICSRRIHWTGRVTGFSPPRLRRYLDFAAWQKLDAIEVARGTREERPRVKLITPDEMFAAVDSEAASQ